MDLKLREKCISFTRRKVKEAIGIDLHIIQLVSHIEDLDKIINQLSKRLRDWYELILPEASHKIRDHATFARVIEDDKKTVMENEGITDSMGSDIEPPALENLREEALNVMDLRDTQTKELEIMMEKEFPNTSRVAGPLIAAKLLAHAGSARNFINFPASTIQLLGAEKALFRHLKTGARPPKYGLILAHPFVAEAENKTKAARHLADKINIAIKIDYFKGEFIGDKLVEDLK